MSSYQPGTPCWVDLGSPDPDEAAAFYGDLLGWEAAEAGPDAGGYRLCTLRGRAVAGLGPQQQPDLPPYWTTYISVADADATAEAATAAGGQVVVPPMDVFDFGRMAMVIDPTGAPVSMWQPLEHIGAELVDEPGTLTWNELTTRKPEAATAFYPAVFGWEAAAQAMGPTTYTEWRLDGRTIGGMMPMDDSWPDIPSHWMVYFAVDDTDAAVGRAQALGGSVTVGPTDVPVGRFAVLGDPHGATFSVITLAPGRAPS